jgi:hypothetical protein
MATWTGLGDNTKLFWAVLSQFVEGLYEKLLSVNISVTVELYNEFHACFRC